MTDTNFIWIVKPRSEFCVNDGSNIVTIAGDFVTIVSIKGDKRIPIALLDQNENQIRYAALMAAAPDLFNALIKIDELLNKSKENIPLKELNEIISLACEKIWAESGG